MAKKKNNAISKETPVSKKRPRTALDIILGLLMIATTAVGLRFLIGREDLAGFGISGFLLFIIPLCIAVRLIVKNSRISVLKSSFVSLTGVFAIGAWISMSTLLLDGSRSMRWGGVMGIMASDWLIELFLSEKGAYFAATACLFLWIVFSFMSVLTSLARYIINKPYVREIILEVEKKPEPAPKPVAVKPEKQKQRKPEQEDGTEVKPQTESKPVKREFGEDELPKYRIPSPSLLKDHSDKVHEVTKAEIARNIEIIRTTLADHRVQVTDIQAIPGPTVTLYKVFPDRGVSVSSIMGKQKDLAVALNVDGVRGEILKDSVGIEVPNEHRSMVPIKDIVMSNEFCSSGAELPIAIGRKVDRSVKVFDLARTPHLLVAGATQQGKSVGLNTMICSLLFAKHPSELQFVFVDPKGNEFDSYKHLYKHYLAVLPGASGESDEIESSVAVRPKQAETILRSLCQEMTERYDLMRAAGSTPNIKTYNEKFKAHKLNPKNGHRLMPYIVAVIDEYADLTMSGSFSPEGRATGRNIMTSIILLASKGRAAGIHLIIATQTPRKDVISGVIKANFPTQIAFKVSNNMDSRVILDNPGAEKLLGDGDMLFSQNARLERVQCAYIGADEIASLAAAVESQRGFQKSFSTPYYLPEVKEDESSEGGSTVDMKKIDERFEEAARLVVETQKASTSYLQTTLGMGFAKSARVMSQLEAAGIVGHADGAKPREVLVKDFTELEPIIQSFKNR